MNKDNWILIFFIVMSLYSLIAVYGATMNNALAWTTVFTLCISFMGLGMIVQKKLKIY